MQPGWGKISQVAEYSGLSEKTLRSLLKQGLRHSRLPSGTIILKIEWVDEYLERYETPIDEKPLDKIVSQLEREFNIKGGSHEIY